MRIAVLSDIHGNHLALEACLREAQRLGVERYLFLGDYVSDCAFPRKTLDVLEALSQQAPCVFLRGNREEYLLAHRAGGESHWCPGSESGSLWYTYREMTPADLDWMAGLPNRQRVELPGFPPMLLCHGNPEKTSGAFKADAPETAELLQGIAEPVVLRGHTHLQDVFIRAGKQVINPGAVGTPKWMGGRGCFAVLESGEGRFEVRLVQAAYDAEAAVAELKTSGLSEIAPVWAAAVAVMLRTGNNFIAQALRMAHALQQEETGRDGFAEEVYWLRAAERLGLTLL